MNKILESEFDGLEYLSNTSPRNSLLFDVAMIVTYGYILLNEFYPPQSQTEIALIGVSVVSMVVYISTAYKSREYAKQLNEYSFLDDIRPDSADEYKYILETNPPNYLTYIFNKPGIYIVISIMGIIIGSSIVADFPSLLWMPIFFGVLVYTRLGNYFERKYLLETVEEHTE